MTETHDDATHHLAQFNEDVQKLAAVTALNLTPEQRRPLTAPTPEQMVYVVTNRVGEPYAVFADHADAVTSCERRGVGYVIPMVIS